MTRPIRPAAIITPDATYRREGMIGRIIIRILMLIGLIFLSAAVIGFGKAIIAPTHTNSPTAHEFAILHSAEKAGGKNCRLEWNAIQGGHEVICAGAMTPSIPLATLRHLASRPAFHNATISDPNGIALIAECLSDSTLNNTELTACLNQPAN